MPRVTHESVIHAPPEAVFAALTDPKAREQWLTTMKESPVDGAIGVGTRIPARRNASGSSSTYELTVTAMEPPRRIVLSVRRNGAPAGAGGYELSAADDGATRALAFAEYELPLLARVMAPLVAANLEKGLAADLSGLKRFVESRRTTAPA